MSRTFDIACTKCKQSLWIGQSDNREIKGHIYSSSENAMTALNKFLFDYVNHPLIFCNDELLYSDYQEVEP